MSNAAERRLYISTNGIRRPIGPDDAELRREYELLVRDDYERCHPGESFDDLMHRAQFSKEDQGLLNDWMAVAAERARQGLPGSPTDR